MPFTLPLLATTAFNTTVPSMWRLRAASGYCGRTNLTSPGCGSVRMEGSPDFDAKSAGEDVEPAGSVALLAGCV
jgi:hypothetical protein